MVEPQEDHGFLRMILPARQTRSKDALTELAAFVPNLGLQLAS